MSFTIKNRFSRIITFAEKPCIFSGLFPECYEKTFQKVFTFFCKCEEFHSLYCDLTASPQELLASFKANTRNEIRRGEKEDFRCEFDIEVECIKTLHVKMAEEKGMDYTSVIREYNSLKPYLFVTCVKRGANILVAHSFLIAKDKKLVMLKSSASSFRSLEKEEQKHIGFANRYLHYQEMLYFKEKGFLIYDFGGYAVNIDENDPKYAINKFKESFCGKKIIYYNYKSFSYIIIENIFRIFSKIKRRKK